MSIPQYVTGEIRGCLPVLRIRYLVAFLLTFFAPLSPVVRPLFAQSYEQSLGVPPFTTALPVESGFINAANGNLHIEIPLGSFPQRGGATDKVVLMYDSAFWTPYYSSGTGFVWEPIGASSGWSPDAAGWRLVTSGDIGTATYGLFFDSYCSDVDDFATVTYSPWIWTAPDGTQHSFSASTTQPLYPSDGYCTDTDVPSSTAYASDGSGFYISISDYRNATVYAPDGTALGPSSFYGDLIKTDPNGNQYTTSTTTSPFEVKYTDTLNRTVVDMTASSGFSTFYYALPNALGGTSTYTLKTQSLNINTAFGYTGWSEYVGTLPELTEIDLPNGTKYQFTYDNGTSSGNYGLLTQMILPTGGTINYGYTNFTDGASNVSRWINQRTTPDSTTPWTYTPSVLSSCTYPYNLNCKQQVTVTKPSGDYAKYTFTLNNGAWPTETDYYDSTTGLLASTRRSCTRATYFFTT